MCVGTPPDHGCYGAVLDACHGAREWAHVHALLFEMRRDGVLSPETMRPFHRSLWQQVRGTRARVWTWRRHARIDLEQGNAYALTSRRRCRGTRA